MQEHNKEGQFRIVAYFATEVEANIASGFSRSQRRSGICCWNRWSPHRSP